MGQRRFFLEWSLRSVIFWWNLGQNTIFIQKNAFQNFICKMVTSCLGLSVLIFPICNAYVIQYLLNDRNIILHYNGLESQLKIYWLFCSGLTCCIWKPIILLIQCSKTGVSRMLYGDTLWILQLWTKPLRKNKQKKQTLPPTFNRVTGKYYPHIIIL